MARTWQWILRGGGPEPISGADWSPFDSGGPPSAATIAAESTTDTPPLRPRTPWPELNRARCICWLCTAQPGDDVPARYQGWDTADGPAAVDDGSVAAVSREFRHA